MSIGIFASDQHKPSVCYEGSARADDGPSNPAPRADLPTAPFDPEVMELEEDPAIEPDPLVDKQDKSLMDRMSRQVLCSYRR